ncbi:OPT oligopeptide transporter protein-domain-containing protein [Dunaliella salina]|uniref:OPT oligopeptide transporter protein-domain-containing protein n=1 Tax=Dunaliella salina TaxID=3046 RepID=A0ABQ7GNI9_DUNSA|nr:OPT oligopeptide transporter protein-domain-containing protein [Dunaliella salina]|eukprot:KAF5836148.1 OPT oligopeptide transporter protein-domain-containing protein [Dunaliella salina]
MAERLPIAPQELEAEEHAALDAIKHEKTLQAQLANVPSWKAQLTGRGITVGLLLGTMFTIVVHKECNVVQTFITACSSVAFTGGFGSYLTAMDRRSYNLLGGDSAQGNREEDIYEPSLYRVIPYLLCTSVIGVFMLVALRKTMIIDYDLTYPSGTATGLMIDSFFTQRGQETAGKQLTQMGRFFGISVAWDAFKWLFSGADCTFCSLTTICGGFEKFPIFGMVAAKWTFYANFTPNIIGAGMICPHIVNVSMVLGAILTWGFLWPYIASKEGIWYDAGQDDTSFAGLFGYKVFLTIALLMGDGLYSLSKVMAASFRAYCATRQQQQQWASSPPSSATRGSGSGAGDDSTDGAAEAAYGPPGFWGTVCWRAARMSSGMRDAVFGRRGGVWLVLAHHLVIIMSCPLTAGATFQEYDLRRHVFVSDVIPNSISVVGYLGFGLLGTLVIPLCYPAVKWYYVITGFLVAPLMALPVSFGCGLTDWDVSSMMGKLAIFAFAAWASLNNGGVIAGLAMAGVVLAATSTSATLMQDFRTGFIVLCAPKAMFAAQLVGALCGALLAPFIPIPMAMAIPFVLGAYIAVDMGLGSLILAIWEWKDAGAAELLAPAVASGLIVGDGVFSLPLSLAGMLNIRAPFCMAFGGASAPTAG